MTVETDNTEGGNDLAAALYRAYRTQGADKTPLACDTEPLDLDHVSDDELASEVYRHYQSNRTASQVDDIAADSDVDNIVQLIMNQADQPVKNTNQENVVVDSGSYQTGRFDWLKRLSKQSANDEDVKPRAWLGVAAAALIGLALFPLFTADKTSTSGLVPMELAQNAEQVTPFIESDGARSIGFSSYDDSVGHAFQYGVIATDLTLYESSGEKTAAIDLVRHYIATTGDLDPAVNGALSLYIDENSNGENGDSDQLFSAFTQQIKQTGQQQWFEMGQAVEMVLLSSRYALATSDPSALAVALDRAKGLIPPDQDLPANRLFSQLRAQSVNGQSQPESGELRQIASLAAQIKSLMW